MKLSRFFSVLLSSSLASSSVSSLVCLHFGKWEQPRKGPFLPFRTYSMPSHEGQLSIMSIFLRSWLKNPPFQSQSYSEHLKNLYSLPSFLLITSLTFPLSHFGHFSLVSSNLYSGISSPLEIFKRDSFAKKFLLI